MNRQPINILLADDDPDDRMLFREAAKQTFRLVILNEAVTGEMAFDMLTNSDIPPDFIVLDINMPGMNGIDCLKMIRSHDRFSRLPVVIMSTSNDYKMISQARKAGANYYGIKPASFNVLKAMLTYLIEQEWADHSVDPEDFLLNNMVF